MRSPKCEVVFSCAKQRCDDCDRKEEPGECFFRWTTAEKIAALTNALKELGVDVVEKKLFDAMTREASKYKMLYDALLTLCAEQGFVPKPPKED